MPISDILELGRQGLVAQQQGLQTTSNNIANTNTPGFSRQKAVLQTNPTAKNGNAFLGGGVDVNNVMRVHDGFVQNQILEESRHFGSFKTRTDELRQIETIVNNDGFRIGDLVNKFYADVRDLASNPEQAALRANVAHSAESTADGFRKLNDSLTAVKKDIDSRIEANTGQINSLTKELASLNGNIWRFEHIGQMPNELYDRRDQVLRDLSTKLGLETSTNDQGHVNITAEGIGVLVNGEDYHELAVLPTPAEGNKAAGSYDLFVKDNFGMRKVTHVLKDGEIGGSIHVRDEVINPVLDHLDHVAYQFATSINDVHKEGVGADG